MRTQYIESTWVPSSGHNEYLLRRIKKTVVKVLKTSQCWCCMYCLSHQEYNNQKNRLGIDLPRACMIFEGRSNTKETSHAGKIKWGQVLGVLLCKGAAQWASDYLGKVFPTDWQNQCKGPELREFLALSRIKWPKVSKHSEKHEVGDNAGVRQGVWCIRSHAWWSSGRDFSEMGKNGGFGL